MLGTARRCAGIRCRYSDTSCSTHRPRLPTYGTNASSLCTGPARRLRRRSRHRARRQQFRALHPLRDRLFRDRQQLPADTAALSKDGSGRRAVFPLAGGAGERGSATEVCAGARLRCFRSDTGEHGFSFFGAQPQLLSRQLLLDPPESLPPEYRLLGAILLPGGNGVAYARLYKVERGSAAPAASAR